MLARDELQAHGNAQTSQAFESLAAARAADLEAKLASSPINPVVSCYEKKSELRTLSAVKPAQRYEKVTDIASSFKAKILPHLAISNCQTIQATAGRPFKNL